MKILITGCAKSGTTLVRRLFQSFDLSISTSEESIDSLISGVHDVVKISYKTIFSNNLDDTEIERQINLIKEHGIKFINVTRDKESVLKSENGKVKEDRYMACVRQFYNHKDIITYNIDYNQLLKHPNEIQNELAKLLDLTIVHKFSDYPDFIDVTKEKFKEGNYKLRKLGEKY